MEIMRIQENIPLAKYTTFKLGGKARFFVHAGSVEDLKEALTFAKQKNLKIFLLGGGSNVLISELGFNGLVIKVEILGGEWRDLPNY